MDDIGGGSADEHAYVDFDIFQLSLHSSKSVYSSGGISCTILYLLLPRNHNSTYLSRRDHQTREPDKRKSEDYTLFSCKITDISINIDEVSQ